MNDILLKKSLDNFEGAKYLNKRKKHLPAVIHCAYYSCFQIVSYILHKKLSKDSDTLFRECKKKNEAIHNISIKNIYSDLYTYNVSKATDFNSFISQLKDLRIDSDYKDVEIIPNDCDKAILLAKKINDILKEKYNYES
jgi:hypothetical protein